MAWEKPDFTEVKMDAEIGSYQGEDPSDDERTVVVVDSEGMND